MNRRPGRRAIPAWALPALVLGVALVCRLLLWQATADRAWPYSALYKGDAVTWLSYAQAIQDGAQFELGIPLRPPGAAYLMAAIYGGGPGGVVTMRAIWCGLGAVTVLLLFLAVRRSYGDGVAGAAGLLLAGSTGLMMLSSSLNNETPYLLLVAVILLLWPAVRERPAPVRLVAWSALNGLACLVRVEHAGFFVLIVGGLAVVWLRGAGRPRQRLGVVARRAGALAFGFVLVLVPWHVKAWSEIHRFNTVPPPPSTPSERAYLSLERSLPQIEWQAAAVERRRSLPAFCRNANAVFVAATLAYRGRQQVYARDLDLIEEAFGTYPEPLGGTPFVALYGGLNFALANWHGSSGGFSPAALDEPPPLAGGAGSYPPMLLSGLPPRDLTLVYPPHLNLINHGYARGWRWIRSEPGRALVLMGRKLAIFWSGASLGLTGLDLPLDLDGPDGLRRRVDLVVPEAGPWVTSWRLLVLGLCAAGLALGWRDQELLPWTLLLVSKLVVTVAFFGYARQGATVIPVVVLACCLAVKRLLDRAGIGCSGQPGRRWCLVLASVLAVGLVGVESYRWLREPVVRIDGRRIDTGDPWPARDHEDRRIEVELAGP